MQVHGSNTPSHIALTAQLGDMLAPAPTGWYGRVLPGGTARNSQPERQARIFMAARLQNAWP